MAITYKNLIETLEIAAKYDGGLDNNCWSMWAEHDEHGIDFKETPTADELRKLSKMGWLLGCDADYNEEDSDKWEHCDTLTDEELIDLFKEHGDSIYKYE